MPLTQAAPSDRCRAVRPPHAASSRTGPALQAQSQLRLAESRSHACMRELLVRCAWPSGVELFVLPSLEFRRPGTASTRRTQQDANLQVCQGQVQPVAIRAFGALGRLWLPHVCGFSKRAGTTEPLSVCMNDTSHSPRRPCPEPCFDQPICTVPQTPALDDYSMLISSPAPRPRAGPALPPRVQHFRTNPVRRSSPPFCAADDTVHCTLVSSALQPPTGPRCAASSPPAGARVTMFTNLLRSATVLGPDDADELEVPRQLARRRCSVVTA